MPSADEADDRRTLERVALAAWPERAGARVRSVTLAGDRAEVSLTISGQHNYWAYYQRDSDGWHETVSGDGPTIDWQDPSAIQW